MDVFSSQMEIDRNKIYIQKYKPSRTGRPSQEKEVQYLRSPKYNDRTVYHNCHENPETNVNVI